MLLSLKQNPNSAVATHTQIDRYPIKLMPHMYPLCLFRRDIANILVCIQLPAAASLARTDRQSAEWEPARGVGQPRTGLPQLGGAQCGPQ